MLYSCDIENCEDTSVNMVEKEDVFIFELKMLKIVLSSLIVVLFCRVPASSRRQKISMILQIAPLTDKISVLG